jgi:hypothetical protein
LVELLFVLKDRGLNLGGGRFLIHDLLVQLPICGHHITSTTTSVLHGLSCTFEDLIPLDRVSEEEWTKGKSDPST